ncbi:DUF5939 domain-containing protein, partial [Streptomyces turgidiscabies]|uniref:DUF5939 domain-containing protein n=1 Tax=Streptomyces turgidiscabies TaxID=85558 RepID=UPI0038F80842
AAPPIDDLQAKQPGFVPEATHAGPLGSERMRDAQTLFAELRGLAPVTAVDAVERLVREAPDHRLNRVNPLAFAAEHKLAETDCIAAFL